jgi:hypothetical protein
MRSGVSAVTGNVHQVLSPVLSSKSANAAQSYSRGVPELDYAFLAEYVRAEAPAAHALSVGIDTIIAGTVPTGQNIGLLFRLGFTRQECGRAHRVEILFQDEDGVRLAQISTVVTPEWTKGLPVHWRQYVHRGHSPPEALAAV